MSKWKPTHTLDVMLGKSGVIVRTANGSSHTFGDGTYVVEDLRPLVPAPSRLPVSDDDWQQCIGKTVTGYSGSTCVLVAIDDDSLWVRYEDGNHANWQKCGIVEVEGWAPSEPQQFTVADDLPHPWLVMGPDGFWHRFANYAIALENAVPWGTSVRAVSGPIPNPEETT